MRTVFQLALQRSTGLAVCPNPVGELQHELRNGSREPWAQSSLDRAAPVGAPWHMFTDKYPRNIVEEMI